MLRSIATTSDLVMFPKVTGLNVTKKCALTMYRPISIQHKLTTYYRRNIENACTI